jgi:hypothetical protein
MNSSDRSTGSRFTDNRGGQQVGDEKPKANNRGRSASIELIAAICFGVLALSCFIWQGMTVGDHSTATETLLFDLLQFILTSGFAWFSTRTVSRREFEESLKKFAISAYRRVADIERMTDRLQTEIEEMISSAPRAESTNLRIAEAIVSDTAQIVRSSISDWGDVIGEELLAIEKIKRLEQEKQRLRAIDDAEEKPKSADVKDIEKTIQQILRTLPPRLQLEAESDKFAAIHTRRAAEWFARRHEVDGGLRLTVVTGDDYLHERDNTTLETGEVLLVERNKEDSLDVKDARGLGVGRLQNPAPLTYDQFADGLELCYAGAPFLVEVLYLTPEEKRSGKTFAWIHVKVVSNPTYRRDKQENSRAPKLDGDRSRRPRDKS